MLDPVLSRNARPGRNGLLPGPGPSATEAGEEDIGGFCQREQDLQLAGKNDRRKQDFQQFVLWDFDVYGQPLPGYTTLVLQTALLGYLSPSAARLSG